MRHTSPSGDVARTWRRTGTSARGTGSWPATGAAPIGEIDLVLRRGRLLVVAEVKARKSGAFGVPALAVTPTKQQRLRRLAAAWLAEHRVGRRVDVRFDVVAITGDAVDVYENAF